MLKIININWLSKEALEAEVTLTDGKFKLICFSHPCNYKMNSEINKHLYCYEISNVLKEKIKHDGTDKD